MIEYDRNFSYFLGFLWSDGFIERYRIGIEILSKDAENIVNDLKCIKFLNICSSSRIRKDRNPQTYIYFCNSKIYDFYFSKYFIDKSFKSPDSLINDIPLNFRRYFFLGIIDGDGCFYYNEKNKTRQFYITSSYDQDWAYIENLFNSIGVKQYEIRKIVSKNGNRNSYIRIKKYDEIKKIYEYLYPNGYEIGLIRKYNKCKLIVDNFVRSNNKSKIDINNLVNLIEKDHSIIEISKQLNCSWVKIYRFCKRNNIKYPNGFFKQVW